MDRFVEVEGDFDPVVRFGPPSMIGQPVEMVPDHLWEVPRVWRADEVFRGLHRSNVPVLLGGVVFHRCERPQDPVVMALGKSAKQIVIRGL